jgi:alanine racemase
MRMNVRSDAFRREPFALAQRGGLIEAFSQFQRPTPEGVTTDNISFQLNERRMKNFDRREFLKLAGAASLGATVAGSEPLGHAASRAGRATPVGGAADPWLEIDLKNMAWNLAQIRRRAGNRSVMAVIKANAYGHGLVETGRFLENQKIEFLAVGKFHEALQLRESGVKTPILNLGPFSQHEAEEIVQRNISQSVYTDDFTLLAESARKLKRQAKVHLKIDTGLGRVGVPHEQALAFVEKVAATSEIQIEGIFTPFTEDDEFDKIQLERLLEICGAAKQRGVSTGLRHAASSAAILSFPQAYVDMVRPGIAIYGQYPSTKEYRARQIDLRPAMSLKARVTYVKTLQPGESVSYHRAFVAQNETLVATLPIGYSDGYPSQAAGKAEILVRGRRWPTIALVTSNHATINVTGAEAIKIGDEAVIFGKQGESEISAEALAAWAGVSVYKILIGMNPLLPRIYLEA